MSSFSGEDQTDADFFDHLVDDDDITSKESTAATAADTMVRDLSSLSLDDVEDSVADVGGSNGSPWRDEQKENSEEAKSVSAGEPGRSVAVATQESDSHGIANSGFSDTNGSLGGKDSGTSVSVMDWSTFGAAEPSGQDYFGSSDFLAQDGAEFDNSRGGELFQTFSNDVVPEYDGFGVGARTSLPDSQSVQSTSQTTAGEVSVNNQLSAFGASGLQSTGSVEPTAEVIESSSTDVNDPSYWEKIYPGWKYDTSTNQWYMADSFSASVANDHESKSNEITDESVYHENAQFNISYPQHSTHAVLETIAEESTVNSVSTWNQEFPGQTGYPPNMVFDPQYPGWFYDTSTGQWCELESYRQSLPVSSTTDENHLDKSIVQDLGPSGGYTEPEMSSVMQSENHFGRKHESNVAGNNWNSFSSSSYNQPNQWQQQEAFSSVTHVNNYSDNMSGSFYSSRDGHATGYTDQQAVANMSGSFYSSRDGHATGYTDQQAVANTSNPSALHNFGNVNGFTAAQSFVPKETYTLPEYGQSNPQLSNSFFNSSQSPMVSQQQSYQSMNMPFSNFSYQPHGGRSSAGRPAHALVAFGFGGKIIVLKKLSSGGINYDTGMQGNSGSVVSILNLSDIVMEKSEVSGVAHSNSFNYFHSLCRQPIPGPLVGSGTSNVNKWIDEKIATYDSGSDYQKKDVHMLVLSLLKILCQNYGKLRSPYGSELSQEENDGPELAVTKLFSSSKMSTMRVREHGSYGHSMKNVPSESQMQATALEVQNLLISGKRKVALQFAQEGQLWGPALVISLQLGDQFYADTVKKMAQCHPFVSGSPLRTLCLLMSGQPAEIFSGENSANNFYGAPNVAPQPTKVPCGNMLDDWEENLAIITANRTKDGDLVMTHLGDCLWKERGEVIAAHCCYLVAEENFQLYSETARMCLIGADHLKYPRTFFTPEAFQMTEVYEYAKVLGNPQYVLLPFQPFKLIYAHMLAEMGKVAEAAKYCQASLKLLKSASRAPELEGWKQLIISLEERIRISQQGGYGSTPSNFVGMFFGQLDKSLSRIIGGAPSGLPPLPPTPNAGNDINSNSHATATKVVNSQSVMAMSSLMPSQSVESMSDLTGDSSRKIKHNRSVSEPDFGRSPKQGGHSNGSPQSASRAGASRLSWIGSTLQKTIGWVAKPRNEAKLGESNKFRYDPNLKRWVEEGAEAPSDEPPLPPPPTSTSFQNGMPDYKMNGPVRNETPLSNGFLEANPSKPVDHSTGMPPIPPSQNQFSAHSRGGVRARYVDTFNTGSGASTRSFHSPAVPSVKPPTGAKFFVPTVPASVPEEKQTDQAVDRSQEFAAMEFPLDRPLESSPPPMIPRTPSMDNITPPGTMGATGASPDSGNDPFSRNRASSWSGAYGPNAYGPSPSSGHSARTSFDGQGTTAAVQSPPPQFMPGSGGPHNRSNSNSSLQFKGYAEDLQDVQL